MTICSAPVYAAASSWFDFFKPADEPVFPQISPLNHLGHYIAESLPDKEVTEDGVTGTVEGFNTWFTLQNETISLLTRPQRDDIKRRLQERLTNPFIIESPQYEYEFTVHINPSLKIQKDKPTLTRQELLAQIPMTDPLYLKVKVTDKNTGRITQEYDLFVTKKTVFGQPSTYSIFDGHGTYSTDTDTVQPYMGNTI